MLCGHARSAIPPTPQPAARRRSNKSGALLVPGLLPDVDPDGLLEYSVVYTDRAINHMSASFQSVMTDISASLKRVYNASAVGAPVAPGHGCHGDWPEGCLVD